MESFLRKQKLIDSISLNLNCDNSTFIEKFRKHIKESDLAYNFFESYQDTKYIYKGNISNSTFKIQKIRSFVGNKHFAVATGEIIENNDSIKIEMKINGINSLMKKILFIKSLFFLFIFTLALFALINDGSLFIIIFFIPVILEYGIIFFMIKSSVKSFKQEIEREFYFWLK